MTRFLNTTACRFKLIDLASLVAVLIFAAGELYAQDAELAPGAGILAPFKQGLQSALRDGLARGPVEAITACQLRAPEIADNLARDGVRVGRTSDRLRNPSNVAPGWVVPLLEAYTNEQSARQPVTITIGPARMGYVEPIVAQPLCLTCHGETLAPDVGARLQALYPTDRATGYRVGDLRGVFWVEYPHAEYDEGN